MTDRIWIGIVALLLAGALVFCAYRAWRRHAARRRVRNTDDEEKCRQLNQLIEPYGFAYQLRQDIFYSLRNSWQRKAGYQRLYDEMAPSMNMIIDCEPIYFEYAGWVWLIELWKGQYGITSGAEIGIYKTEPVLGKSPRELFYQAVSDKDSLLMSISLRKDDRLLFGRRELHWWLTGFALGEFSEKSELTLAAELIFTEREMRDAFLQGAARAGYTNRELSVCGNTVALTLRAPRTRQPNRYGRLYQWLIQRINHQNCRKYLRLTRCFDRTLDRLIYLFYAFPHVYRVMMRITWGQRKKEAKP